MLCELVHVFLMLQRFCLLRRFKDLCDANFYSTSAILVRGCDRTSGGLERNISEEVSTYGMVYVAGDSDGT